MKIPLILIVDDESYIREFLAEVLSENFRIAFAKNGSEALEISKAVNPSLILLDLSMPGQSGIEVCDLLRKQKQTANTPVIILTASNEPEKRILAFNVGADDFVSKPFFTEELIARINRKLENAKKLVSSEVEGSMGYVKLDTEALSVEIDGIRCELGQVEYKILNILLKKKGGLVSRQELNNYVWENELPSERALDPHITSLRKKLQKSQGEIKTVYGKGYSIILKEREF